MIQRVFLGGNTCRGFFSLYGGFPPDPGGFLHILKGGPGNGKSGFLRALGTAAEARGLDVQYVLCSGDPDSLDGVYLPELGQAWVDGTAPHAVEPRHFGADSDYEDLGRFCRKPLSPEDCARVRQLSEEYRALYREAYEKLAAAKALHDELEAVYRPYMDFDALTAYTEETVRRVFDMGSKES